jgi:hypothetical protein
MNASHFEQCQRVPLSCSCGMGRSLVSVVSIRPSLPMQDLRYAGPSIGELSTITGAEEMTANRGPFFLPAPDRLHVFVAACQFLHLAGAKSPPRVKPNRGPQGSRGACPDEVRGCRLPNLASRW